MYLDNSFYSHRRILSKYCGVKDKKCFASIQHGSFTLRQEREIGKRFFSISPFLCWNERLLQITKKNKIPNVISIGAPFLYLDILMKNTDNMNTITGIIDVNCKILERGIYKMSKIH